MFTIRDRDILLSNEDQRFSHRQGFCIAKRRSTASTSQRRKAERGQEDETTMYAGGETYQERSKGKDVRTSNIVAAKVRRRSVLCLPKEGSGSVCYMLWYALF